MAEERVEVVVTDVRMPFGSMVVFLVKWTLASIPALIILFVIGAALSGVAIGIFRGIASSVRPTARASTEMPVSDTAAANAGGSNAPTLPAGAPLHPITGTMHTVRMLGDAQGYRFEPANVTVRAGDGIRFVNVSGAPHNVAFDPAEIPNDVAGQLSANMPNQMSELNGPLLVNPNESYTISFEGVKTGAYAFHCTPHLAMGMDGTVRVR